MQEGNADAAIKELRYGKKKIALLRKEFAAGERALGSSYSSDSDGAAAKRHGLATFLSGKRSTAGTLRAAEKRRIQQAKRESMSTLADARRSFDDLTLEIDRMIAHAQQAKLGGSPVASPSMVVPVRGNQLASRTGARSYGWMTIAAWVFVPYIMVVLYGLQHLREIIGGDKETRIRFGLGLAWALIALIIAAT